MGPSNSSPLGRATSLRAAAAHSSQNPAARCLSVALGVALASLAGCVEPSATTPLRSPSNDYRPPPPTTSDGQVVGVDRRSPADKLAEGPANGRAAPGWAIDSHGISYDPNARVGGAIDRSDSKASAPTSSPNKTQAP